jgi:uncharacterized protein (UPF0332 family)
MNKFGKPLSAQLARIWLAHAEESLRVLELDIESADFRTALFDAYFAMFRAEKALLASVNAESRTHAGTLYLFAERFVKTGQFERRWLSTLTHGKQVMRQYDENLFELHPTRKQALKAQADAEEFVRQAKVVLASSISQS